MTVVASRLAAYVFLLACHSVVFIVALGSMRGGDMIIGHEELRALGSLLLFSIVVTCPFFFAALVVLARRGTADTSLHVWMGVFLGAVGYAVGGAITHGGLVDVAILAFQGGLVGAIIGLAFSAIDVFITDMRSAHGRG